MIESQQSNLFKIKYSTKQFKNLKAEATFKKWGNFLLLAIYRGIELRELTKAANQITVLICKDGTTCAFYQHWEWIFVSAQMGCQA